MSLELANKIINYANLQYASSSPSAILGSGTSLSQALQVRPQIRIGMWPILNADLPQTAMGIYTILSWLLDVESQVISYRVIANVGNDNQGNFKWDISKSQFDIDDWEFDGLDDNVGLWGNLESGEDYTLTFEIENDLDISEVGDETLVLTFTSSSLADLISQLPFISRRLIETIDQNVLKPYESITNYRKCTLSDDQIKPVLDFAFRSELDIFYKLLEQPDSFIRQEEFYNHLEQNDDFASWVVGMVVKRRLQPGYTSMEFVDKEPNWVNIVLKNREDATVARLLSRYFFELGRVADALELAESAITESTSADSWLNVADLQIRSGRSSQAIESFQKAISKGYVSPVLCYSYAQFINLYTSRGLTLDNYVFISDEQEKQPALEVLAAYDKALELLSVKQSVSVTFIQQILADQCIVIASELSDDLYFWKQFGKLVELDSSGDLVRLVIDELYNVIDLQPGIDILHEHLDRNPRSIALRINLSALHIENDEEDIARGILNEILDLTDDPVHIKQVQELLLSANDPDFELKIGQLVDKLDAGSVLTDSEIDFLEEVTELSPSYDEGYILLAKGYLSRSDEVAATEVLLDALETITNNPDIYEILAQILRETDANLAYQYIENGLKIDRNHVPLLALSGLYLFQDGDFDTAKVFLLRAEAIDPRNRRLVAVRSEIASLFNEN